MGTRVTTHYPWHPLKGETVEIRARIRAWGTVELDVCADTGQRFRLPEWMTQSSVCEGMVLSAKPVCDVPALLALRAQLEAWSAGRDQTGARTDADAGGCQ